MSSTCLVSARDYARYFAGRGELARPAWNGVERRKANADRRANAHDRRWQATEGRRARLGDRRRRL